MADDRKVQAKGERAQVRLVRAYLDSVRPFKPGRAPRTRDVATIQNRLSVVDSELVDAVSVRKLKLLQERLDLVAEIERVSLLVEADAAAAESEAAALRAGFVWVAKAFGERAGLSFDAWLQLGVSEDVLKDAGIDRSEQG